MSRTIKSNRSSSTRTGSPVPGELVHATRTADLVDVPKRRCLAIDGAGSPTEARFADAISALYGTAYTLKFARKRPAKVDLKKPDFKVGPLEGHWAADVPPGSTERPVPERWRWRLRIGVPSDVTKDELDRIKQQVVRKKGGKLEASPVVGHVFLEAVPAQRLGRILHVGPYGDEPASFELIAKAIDRAKLIAAPTHIEVYLNDPSRTKPAGLKTVLLRELAAS
jgi:hypothetical protein